MNRVLLNCSNTDECGEAGAYAVLEINDYLIDIVARRRKLFLSLLETDDKLEDIRFQEDSPIWYPIGSQTPKQQEEGGLDTLLDLIKMPDGEDGDWVEFTDGVGDAPDSMEMEQMIIDERGVRWTASPIDENYYCVTPLIPYEQLFQGRL